MNLLYKTVFTFFFLLLHLFSNAQFSGVSVNSKEYQAFTKSKMLVVLQNSPKYDSAITKAVRNNWYVTDFQFITFDELPIYQNMEGFSFLSPINIEYIKSSEAGPYTELMPLVAVFMADKKKFSKYKLNDMIAYVPLDYKDLEMDRLECFYRIDLIVISLQKTIFAIKKYDIKKNKPQKINAKLINIANEKAPLLSKKTLLINEKYLNNKLTDEIIRTKYPYEYIIATTNFIKEAIENKDSRYAVLIKASGFETSITVQETARGDVIYLYLTYKRRKELNKKDFARLFKAVSKI
jgi:hypothetical protein